MLGDSVKAPHVHSGLNPACLVQNSHGVGSHMAIAQLSYKHALLATVANENDFDD